MKLVFFSLAFAFMVVLIPAQDVSKDGHVDVPPGQASAPRTPSQTLNTPKPRAPEMSAPKAGSPDQHSGSEHTDTSSATPDSEDKTKTTSTTEKPTTLEPTPPKPTPQPTPLPAGHWSWNVTDPITKLPCIMVSGTISLKGTLKNYTDKHVNETAVIGLGPKTRSSGSCADKQIRWHLDSHNSSLQFEFSVNTSSHEVSLSRVDGLVYFEHFNGTAGFKNQTLHAFETPGNKSYFCGKLIELPLKEAKDQEFSVKLENFQIQAFKTSKSDKFDDSIDGCPSSSGGGPDVIPIVVGCALAILVVVVLVAYLINRRRSQAHGYLSM